MGVRGDTGAELRDRMKAMVFIGVVPEEMLSAPNNWTKEEIDNNRFAKQDIGVTNYSSTPRL